ncbi:MAG: hypothetical protein JWQ79_1082, partial [Mucilaginibacter sp.]|nr:hypothetical protein [Mucilaginibacter sp.]
DIFEMSWLILPVAGVCAAAITVIKLNRMIGLSRNDIFCMKYLVSHMDMPIGYLIKKTSSWLSLNWCIIYEPSLRECRAHFIISKLRAANTINPCYLLNKYMENALLLNIKKNRLWHRLPFRNAIMGWKY